MAPKPQTRADDEAALHLLDLRFNEGLTTPQIATRLGLSKNAVIGRLSRLKEGQVYECACRKRENKDGGMPRYWWKSK